MILNELRLTIENIVNDYCTEPSIKEALLRALARPGYALHPESSCRAGVLVLEVYRSIRGGISEGALLGAGGVELVMEACFMFDNVADEEVKPQYRVSSAEELSMAISLLATGIAAVHQAAQHSYSIGSKLALVSRYVSEFNAACAGQFLDAHLVGVGSCDSNKALQMTSLKAGGLGKSSAMVGACLAGGTPDVVDLFGEFGLNLFTYLQLIDDLRDACPVGEMDCDLVQNKRTVPLVFFYNSLQPGNDGLNTTVRTEIDDLASARTEYIRSGAHLFGATVAEAYLNRARANLKDLKESLGAVETLERLVGSLEISLEEFEVGT